MQYLFSVRLATLVMFFFSWMGVSAQQDTSKNTLPSNALYIIDLKESTKEEVEKLDKKTIKSVNVWKGETATMKYGEKGKNGVVVITTFSIDKKDEYDKVFTKAAKQAYFPGSMDGWNKYLADNLKYPQSAKQSKIEGTARVQFLIDKEGNLYDLKLLEDPGYGLGEEALRLLKSSPKWVPAEQNGQKVINRLVVPVTFKL